MSELLISVGLFSNTISWPTCQVAHITQSLVAVKKRQVCQNLHIVTSKSET